jgi:O-antigen ligase
MTTLIGDTAAGAQLNLSDSDGGRLEAILAGPALFALSPIFGIGFGQYRFMAPQVTDGGAGMVAHNWYGTVLAEQGIVGVILWSLLLITVVVWMRRRPSAPRRVGIAMLSAACFGSLFTMPPQHYQTGFVPAMVLTAALVANWSRGTARETARRPLPSAPGALRPYSAGA